MAEEANRVMKTEEAPAVLRRAKTLVPVKSGRLKVSGKLVEKRSVSGTEFEISFGGGEVDYALKVHETHAMQPKFLERAVREAAPGMTQRLASRLSKTLKRIVK